MTATIAFIAGYVFGALGALFVIGIQAHHHFWAMNARKQDDHGFRRDAHHCQWYGALPELPSRRA